MAFETHNRSDLDLSAADEPSSASEPLPMGTALPIIFGLCALLWLAIGLGVEALS